MTQVEFRIWEPAWEDLPALPVPRAKRGDSVKPLCSTVTHVKIRSIFPLPAERIYVQFEKKFC